MKALLHKVLDMLFFLRVTPLIRLGRKKALEAEDMPELPKKLRPENASPAFDDLPLSNSWGFIAGIVKVMRREALIMLLMTAVLLCAHLLVPFLIHEFIRFLQNPIESVALGIALAAAFTLVSAGESVLLQHYFYQAVSSTQVIVNGLNRRLYQKSLRLSQSARMRYPVGDIVNYMGADSDALAEVVWVGVETLYSVALVSMVSISLFFYLGKAAIGGVVVLAFLVPLTRALGRAFIQIDDDLMRFRDQRVSLFSQILSGMRLVKYFAWQNQVEREIGKVRAEEIYMRRKNAVFGSFSLLMYFTAGALVAVVSFSLFVYWGGKLDAATVFACLALFGLLDHPFGHMTDFVTQIAESKVSAARLIKFFNEPEKTANLTSDPVHGGEVGTTSNRTLGLRVANVCLAFEDQDEDKLVLKDISFDVVPGESVAIVGRVGAGKSTLLKMMLGEVVPQSGGVFWLNRDQQVRPRIGYVPQEAFVQNGSLLDNIVFGCAKRDKRLVDAAIAACGLMPDLQLWPAGLNTEIGEHGVNLSGGQKQRLGLARACYFQPEVVLLDDPLSAVDVDTENYLVENLLEGIWANKTRIVVTHRLNHLERFDRVLFVDQGRIEGYASYQELKTLNSMFHDFVREAYSEKNENEDIKDSKISPAPMEASRITVDEDREQGAVALKIYWTYLKSMSGARELGPWLFLPLMAFTATSICMIPMLQSVWLSVWTNKAEASDGSFWQGFLRDFQGDDWQNVMVFSVLGALMLVAIFCHRYLWATRSVIAGQLLHDRAVSAVLRAKIRFFDSTPIGRILNRFSRDLDSIEKNLTWSFDHTIHGAIYTVTSLLVIVSVIPLLSVVLLPVILVYYKLQKDYRASAREAQRLSSMARSPRFAHFKETLMGLSVIRAFGREQAFEDDFRQKLGESQKMFHSFVLTNRWFSIRIPLVSAVVTFATALAVIFLAKQSLIMAGTAGLVIFYAMRFWNYLNWMVRAFGEVEARMTAVERLRAFADIEPEPEVTLEPALEAHVPWPQKGTVTFEGVCLRYGDAMPDVLRGVDLDIPAGAKVGIIGRTGAGKTTLFQALYRFVEVSAGRICIDGVDIRRVPINRLRRSIAIIPQDPTLFMGYLRDNLDRYQMFTDDEIWRALESVHLGDFVRSLDGMLGAKVSENGHNFSQGQRQLFCLARALLLDAKVIVMDEATASIDVESDRMIQEAIREHCSRKTMLVIAHRLETIADCDLVVEMVDGKAQMAARRAWRNLTCEPQSDLVCPT